MLGINRHLVLAVALLSVLARGQNLRVTCLDASRMGACGNSSLDFQTGIIYSTIRAALLAPSYFGPAGICTSGPVVLTAVSSLTTAVLQSTDIYLHISDGAGPGGLLTDGEIERLNAFILQGGGAAFFQNCAFDQLSHMLLTGPATDCPCTNCPACPSQWANSSHAIAFGPFGSIPSGTSVTPTYKRVVNNASLGPFMDQGLAITGGSTLGATFQLGAGRIVAFGDEEMLIDTAVSSICGTSALTQSNLTIFLNSMSWLVPPAGFAFDPALARFRSHPAICAAPTAWLTVLGDPGAPVATIGIEARGLTGMLGALIIDMALATPPPVSCQLLLTPTSSNFLLFNASAPVPCLGSNVGSFSLAVTVPNGLPPIFAQVAVADPGQPGGFSTSHAVEMR